MMNVFAHDGTSGFSGIWSTITSARSFNEALLNPPQEATHWVRYTTGGTAALKLQEKLTGGTSASTCTLVAQAVENGTAGSSDSGIILINVKSAAFQAETLTGSVSTGTVAIAQDFIPLRVRTAAKAALITIETASVQFTDSGVIPTVTAGTNYGHFIDYGQSIIIRGYERIRRFAVINAVNASGSILKYTLYF